MKSKLVQLEVPLSHLVPSRRNPRKVKPGKEANQRLVALIESQGLLQPLVIRPLDGKPKRYEVVAGEQRLRALKEIHRGNDDPKIPCMMRDVDDATADAMSLGENFGREQMHPLDEAEAFAKLASADGKDAEAIAAEFGVPEHYVRQRMKLATLAPVVKAVYRKGQIDTSIAEAFAAVPEAKQLDVWKEVNGHPRHAEHVRNIIANGWIDVKHALFDLSKVPELSVSRDLFEDRVLVERKAFMEAQATAVETQRQALSEDGWKEVVVGRREDVQDLLYAMDRPEQEFDEQTMKKLAKLAARRQKLETNANKIDESDETRLNRFQQRYEALEAQEEEVIKDAKQVFSEETKSLATAFLILDPDGQVHREVRIPKAKARASGGAQSGGGGDGVLEKPKAPTSADLSDKQLATTFTHQCLAVREALLIDEGARKRMLAMILHDRLSSEALSIRHEANGTTVHADNADGFVSEPRKRLGELRSKVDPFAREQHVEDVAAYERLGKLSNAKLDTLIGLLIVEHLTAHMQRPTELVERLASELKVDVRKSWTPDADWLSGFQKIQLAHLIVELKGPVHAPAPEKKKSELVQVLSKLFADAVNGKLEDKDLAEKLNTWLPSNLRERKAENREQRQRSKRSK